MDRFDRSGSYSSYTLAKFIFIFRFKSFSGCRISVMFMTWTFALSYYFAASTIAIRNSNEESSFEKSCPQTGKSLLSMFKRCFKGQLY